MQSGGMCHPAQSAGVTESLGWQPTWGRSVSGVYPDLHRLLQFLSGFSPRRGSRGVGDPWFPAHPPLGPHPVLLGTGATGVSWASSSRRVGAARAGGSAGQ